MSDSATPSSIVNQSGLLDVVEGSAERHKRFSPFCTSPVSSHFFQQRVASLRSSFRTFLFVLFLRFLHLSLFVHPFCVFYSTFTRAHSSQCSSVSKFFIRASWNYFFSPQKVATRGTTWWINNKSTWEWRYILCYDWLYSHVQLDQLDHATRTENWETNLRSSTVTSTYTRAHRTPHHPSIICRFVSDVHLTKILSRNIQRARSKIEPLLNMHLFVLARSIAATWIPRNQSTIFFCLTRSCSMFTLPWVYSDLWPLQGNYGIFRRNVERSEGSFLRRDFIREKERDTRRTFRGTINCGSFGQIKVNVASTSALDVGVFRVSWLLSRWVKRRDRWISKSAVSREKRDPVLFVEFLKGGRGLISFSGIFSNDNN